ncbi:amidase [Solirubrobacter taibaiensis]|nr:amidase [Solirubrobacter taibaiensis]
MLSAVSLRAAFAARDLSPVEVIDAFDELPEYGAFITLSLDRAREEAKRAEQAYKDGTARPLEGLTLAVKDLFDTEGVRTTYGSSIFSGHVPTQDAAVVAKARAAGAIVVGKTLTHEFAWGITSVNPHFPACRNPHDPERVPGGSSGGSAVALALGQAALALGTDTGGSIRIPAAFCGVSGLKPTYGLLSTEGIYPLARSLDHAGPMARTPADVKLFFEALAHRAPDEPATRIALCPDLHVRALEPDIQRVFDHAVSAFDTLEVSFDHAGRLYPTYASIQNGEAAQTHAQLFPQRREDYGADVAARIENAMRVTLAEYTEAIAERERIRAAFQRIFTVADVLLTPVAAVPPELREEPDPQGFRDGVLPYTVPQDVAGLPTCAVPVGFDDRHLPVSVQVTGPPRSEARVLTFAEVLFSATASARAGSSSGP